MTRADLISEVEHLGHTDTPQATAARLGYKTPNNLARALMRAGRHDLARRYNIDTRVPELYRHESEARRIRWAHEARNEQEAS